MRDEGEAVMAIQLTPDIEATRAVVCLAVGFIAGTITTAIAWWRLYRRARFPLGGDISIRLRNDGALCIDGTTKYADTSTTNWGTVFEPDASMRIANTIIEKNKGTNNERDSLTDDEIARAAGL
jgi:hypothetical protein